MSSPKIKPCPFCGGLADIRYSFDTLLIECTNKNCKLQPFPFYVFVFVSLPSL